MSVWFFFSSRRRHTRCAISDWSSDVCSSDLRCTGLFGEADFLPRRALGQQRAHQLVVECVAGLVALEGADAGVAGQVQVADRVEDLVAPELVAVAQAGVVEHAELVQDADRKSVVEGKSVSVRVDLGGRRLIKKKKIK